LRGTGSGVPQPEEVARVDGLTHEGEGVVHAGKTVFVAGALPGERIRFARGRRHRQHDDGVLLEVLEASPLRSVPRCAHFGVCGGCALQHLDPAAQLAAKQTELKEALTRVGQVQPQRWLAPVSGPVWGYRRRARLGAKFVRKKGRVLVGFRERAAPYVAELARCEVLSAPAGALIAPLAQLFDALTIREQLPQVEVAVADNTTALVLRVLSAPAPQDLALLRAFAKEHAVQFFLQPGGMHTVAPLDADAPPLRYGLADFALTLEFRPTDFIQVNAAVNAALVSRAVQLLDLDASSQVLDLFCGLGNFTLALARSAGLAVGVEGEAALIERARGNAALNEIGNAHFHVANLSTAPDPQVPWLAHPYSHVLLDPPRTGAHAVLGTVAALGPQRVLYISCHPGSLARDLGVLVNEHGMVLEAAGVVDMFPHTTHVESLALLCAPPGRTRRQPAPA
jgi:23S rRNA (uracil1939-C5)-methyltransferase